MTRATAELAMMLLAITAAVLLVAYGLLANGGTPTADPVFWLLAIAFLVYVAWDVRRHMRAIRARSAPREGKSP